MLLIFRNAKVTNLRSNLERCLYCVKGHITRNVAIYRCHQHKLKSFSYGLKLWKQL